MLERQPQTGRPTLRGRIHRFLQNARKSLSWCSRGPGTAPQKDESPAPLPTSETATTLQQEAIRQIEWWIDNLPSDETMRADVARAINCVRPAEGGGTTEFTQNLFRSFNLSAPIGPTEELYPKVRIGWYPQTDLRRIKMVGSTTTYADTRSGRGGKVSKRSAKGPFSPGHLAHQALTLAVDAPDDSAPFFSLPVTFTVYTPPSSATHYESASVKDRVEAQRQTLVHCMTQCLVNKKLGGSGLGIAMVGDSFSYVWAAEPRCIVVEAAKGIPLGKLQVKDLAWLLEENKGANQIFAQSFLSDRNWDRRSPLRPSDISVKAVQAFIGFVRESLVRAAEHMGPEGPLVWPDTTCLEQDSNSQ